MVKSRILIFFLIILVSRISSQTTTAITQVSADESQREILLSSDKINLSQNNLACTVTATNDNFANAQTLIVNGGTVSGTTCGSLEPGETQGCNNGTESVWYKFTATLASQFVQITQTSGGCYYGSAVYSITALPTSTCNNTDLISCQALNTGPITQLYQLTSLSIGTTYYIQIIYVSGGS